MICRRKSRTVRIILILIDMEKKFELTDKFVFNTFGINYSKLSVQSLSNMPRKVIWEDMLRKMRT